MLKFFLLGGITLLVIYLVREHFTHYPDSGKE